MTGFIGSLPLPVSRAERGGISAELADAGLNTLLERMIETRLQRLPLDTAFSEGGGDKPRA